jgi:excisionase family DNA binding protein
VEVSVQPRLVTAQVVAQALSCSVSWVYEAAQRGIIPSYHVGNRLVRFDIDEVIEASRQAVSDGQA